MRLTVWGFCKMRLALITFAAVLISGCSAPTCLQVQPYESAQLYPGLDAPPGLIVPEPSMTMRVPEVEDGPVGVYPDSKHREVGRMRCLVMPRRLEHGAG